MGGLDGVGLNLGEDESLADGHLVGGQGAGLVRADDGGAAEGLHRGQRPDNGVLLGHTAGSWRKEGTPEMLTEFTKAKTFKRRLFSGLKKGTK